MQKKREYQAGHAHANRRLMERSSHTLPVATELLAKLQEEGIIGFSVIDGPLAKTTVTADGLERALQHAAATEDADEIERMEDAYRQLGSILWGGRQQS